MRFYSSGLRSIDLHVECQTTTTILFTPRVSLAVVCFRHVDIVVRVIISRLVNTKLSYLNYSNKILLLLSYCCNELDRLTYDCTNNTIGRNKIIDIINHQAAFL